LAIDGSVVLKLSRSRAASSTSAKRRRTPAGAEPLTREISLSTASARLKRSTSWPAIGGHLSSGNDAYRTGAAIGATIGTGMIFFFWAAGALITGLFALLTRGRKTYIEETIE
jgi:hypothetical protein